VQASRGGLTWVARRCSAVSTEKKTTPETWRSPQGSGRGPWEQLRHELRRAHVDGTSKARCHTRQGRQSSEPLSTQTPGLLETAPTKAPSGTLLTSGTPLNLRPPPNPILHFPHSPGSDPFPTLPSLTFILEASFQNWFCTSC
jgi:hypothetical protein